MAPGACSSRPPRSPRQPPMVSGAAAAAQGNSAGARSLPSRAARARLAARGVQPGKRAFHAACLAVACRASGIGELRGSAAGADSPCARSGAGGARDLCRCLHRPRPRPRLHRAAPGSRVPRRLWQYRHPLAGDLGQFGGGCRLPYRSPGWRHRGVIAPRTARAYWPGVMPKAPLKRLLRWLWSTKPAPAAADAMGSPAAIRRRASASRSLRR